MNVYVIAPKEDFGKVDGLCGNYDGVASNDISSNQPDNQTPPNHGYTNKYRCTQSLKSIKKKFNSTN